MTAIRAFIVTLSEHPKTTVAGISAVVGGIALLSEHTWTEGVVSIITGIGLLLSADAKPE